MKYFLIILFFLLSGLAFGQFPGCPDVDAGPDQVSPCPDACVTLTANPIVSGITTSYIVNAIPHDPPIAYNAPGGNAISVNIDDVWSSVINLPFSFCFYGNTYTTCRVGSNGAIRLGSGGTTGGFHPWQFNASVPSNDLVSAGNIFGIYHDIDPSVFVSQGGGVVKWHLLGTAPCRIFVVTFYELAHFDCNNLRSTHQMVLYETTNVIDVYAQKKQICNAWNNGNAVIGIQNPNGSMGLAAPGRNTGSWTISTPEAWRFSPSGPATYSVTWLQNGQVISNNLSVQVCPSQTTSYTASVDYTPCSGGPTVTVTDNVTVVVQEPVATVFNITPPIYCQNDIIAPLPSTSNNGITGSWSPAWNNQQTTTYTFTPNPNQCANSVQATITITPTIVPNFNFPLSFCQGDVIPSLPSTSTNGVSGTWSPAVNNQQTTSYTFTPNNNQNCTVSAQATIQVLPFVTPSFNSSGPFCEGATVPALPTISNNGISGVWSPALNNQQTTTYTFTPNPGACATGNVSTMIVIVPNVDPVFTISPTVFCQNEVVPNLPTQSNNGIVGAWSPAINNQQTTTYSFTSSGNNCVNPFSQTITILPIAFSNNTVAICATELPYLWNNQLLSASGNYSADFMAQNGCDSTANLAFTVLPILESTSVLDICEDDIPFTWNGLTINTTGEYEVLLTSSFGCDSITKAIATIRPMPVVSFEADVLSGCGLVITNLTTTSNLASSTCSWSFSDGTTSNLCNLQNKQFNAPGCYDVTLNLTSQYGCSSSLTFNEYICVYPVPDANFVISPSVLSVFDNTANFINLSTNFNQQFWDFGYNGITSNLFAPSYTYPNDAPGFYDVWLYLENEFGCVDSTFRQIQLVIEPVYYIPNTFTPDGDKFNSVFLPVFSAGFDPYQYNLLIFNRWGEVLFESNNAEIGWDGTYGGRLSQEDVYVYQIVFKHLFSDKQEVIRGHLNLLR